MININLAKNYANIGKKLYKQGVIGSFMDDGRMHLKTKAFRELFEDKEYKITHFDNRTKYEYSGVIGGVSYFTITNNFLFEGDEDKLESEEI